MQSPKQHLNHPFYCALKQGEFLAYRNRLNEAIANQTVCELNEDWFLSKASIVQKANAYFRIPEIKHPSFTAIAIHKVLIPRSTILLEKSSVSGQHLPTLIYTLFKEIKMLSNEYDGLINMGLETSARRVLSKIENGFYKIMQCYKNPDIKSAWDLLDIYTDNEVPHYYQAHFLDLNTPKRPIKSRIGAIVVDEIKAIRLIDASNIFINTKDLFFHFSMEKAKVLCMFNVVLGDFNDVRGTEIEYHTTDGFIRYNWDKKRWNTINTNPTEITRIILSSEEKDTIINTGKDKVMTLFGIYSEAKVSTKDSSGKFALVMDKEAYGGIYELITGNLVLDTSAIDWELIKDMEVPYASENGLLQISKAAALWVGENAYQFTAYGKVIKNNTCISQLTPDILHASYALNGKLLFLVNHQHFFSYRNR